MAASGDQFTCTSWCQKSVQFHETYDDLLEIRKKKDRQTQRSRSVCNSSVDNYQKKVANMAASDD